VFKHKQCFLVAIALTISAGEGRSDDLLLAYSGPETLVCPPAGYRPKPESSDCSLDQKKVRAWISAGKLTERLPKSRIFARGTETQYVRLPAATVAYLRRYHLDGVAHLIPSRRSAVVLILQWSVKEPRVLAVQREQKDGNLRKSFETKVSPAAENYYHASIQDLNPEFEVAWSIRSNSRVYKIQFVAGQ
jgi:hypothetical protein